MARTIGKLSSLTVSRIKQKGLHGDGGGLYLRVKADGGKYWAFRYTRHGKAREMGLGALHTVTLAEAREEATKCRKMLTNKIDPIGSRNACDAQLRLADAREKTFKECAEAYIEAHKAGWRNEKHAWQWENTLERFAYPAFGSLPVNEIDVGLVLKAIEPIWKTKTETASRVRGRIEVILDWAATRGHRTGENPARWKGHLENLLAPRNKVQKVTHQPALPYDQIGDFMASLKGQNGTAAQALQFTILTAARTNEVIGATWDEIDLEKKTWTIPASRIKAEREHKVPLSDEALRILKDLKKERNKQDGKKSPFIFGGLKKGKPLSNVAMLALLKRMERTDITVHGFRSSFRDWAAEQTSYPREVAEAALAHISGDKVEASYLRTDFFDKRRNLMDAWVRYCLTTSTKSMGQVIPMRKA